MISGLNLALEDGSLVRALAAASCWWRESMRSTRATMRSWCWTSAGLVKSIGGREIFQDIDQTAEEIITVLPQDPYTHCRK